MVLIDQPLPPTGVCGSNAAASDSCSVPVTARGDRGGECRGLADVFLRDLGLPCPGSLLTREGVTVPELDVVVVLKNGPLISGATVSHSSALLRMLSAMWLLWVLARAWGERGGDVLSSSLLCCVAHNWRSTSATMAPSTIATSSGRGAASSGVLGSCAHDGVMQARGSRVVGRTITGVSLTTTESVELFFFDVVACCGCCCVTAGPRPSRLQVGGFVALVHC